jgi:hypothetical protein
MPDTAPSRPVPLLGEISLDYVQHIEHRIEGGYLSSVIPGLEGELQQRVARPSHRMTIRGLLYGDSAADSLSSLQEAAQNGQELTFSADITSALDIQNVVIEGFHCAQEVATPGRYSYEIRLVESPPLPPPAQISGFGGLGDFGLGDLGFDTDIMGDLTDLAGDLSGALNDALGVLDALGGLAGLDGLSVGGILQPMQDVGNSVSPLASRFKDSLSSLSDLFGG